MDYFDWIWRDSDQYKRQSGLVLLWSIWTYRNQIVHSTIEQPCSQKIRAFTESKIYEFTTNLGGNLNMEDKNLPRTVGWTPPAQHLWKLNVDATWMDSLHAGGLGWIVRDSEGRFIMAECLKALSQSLTLEAGIKIEMESDCLEVVNIINKSSMVLTEVSLIVEDIWKEMESLPIEGFKHLPMKANGVAHGIARRACVFVEHVLPYVAVCFVGC
ncbi:uncharacterized protein LOC111017181 [Momordica charantia]|uniref:Uncharacterized protein LOC111017181 n=1 Tax=Momordica charantia TaxID=3673 RepID=A0A6J1D4B6_MOMCH|nr:uncharacterized protein LOC111017181 [Momordica charantia]